MQYTPRVVHYLPHTPGVVQILAQMGSSKNKIKNRKRYTLNKIMVKSHLEAVELTLGDRNHLPVHGP
jgi:hypothetical protein